MPVFVVANPKGGVGKSTLATNLAGYFASQHCAVMLGDIDVQQSSRTWLQHRGERFLEIKPWELNEHKVARPPKGTTHIVLDTPAGITGSQLDSVIKIADWIIVPLQPSIFDIFATEAFLKTLAQKKMKAKVGVVGMRVNSRSKSAEQLSHYVTQLGLPVLGFLRDTQNYIQLAAHGATIWDIAPSKVDKDLEQWRNILSWLEHGHALDEVPA